MKTLLSILKITIYILVLFLIHFFTVFFLPYPLNTINIFFIFFTFFILGWERSTIIWIAFIIFYIFGLYAITPLGFIVIPGVLAVMIMYVLYINVFTNRSLFTSIALIVISILFFRLTNLLLLSILNYSAGISVVVLRNFFIGLFWETFLTSFITGTIFFVLSKKSNRFSRDRVSMFL